MYILVNKRPLNALFLEVSNIYKFNQRELEDIYCLSDNAMYSIILNAAKEAGLCTIETKTSYIDGKYPHTEEERICTKEGYYFTVKDYHYILCSKFYETEADAEAARDKLLLMANKIIARLYKVEI